MLRVKHVQIQDVGGIRSLELPLNDGVNIICGPNGIGKSTIVESIIGSLIPFSQRLARNVNSSTGHIKVQYLVEGVLSHMSRVIDSFADQRQSPIGYTTWVKEIMFFRPNRLILYQILTAIQKQEFKSYNKIAQEYQNAGIALEPSKNWLAQRTITPIIQTAT